MKDYAKIDTSEKVSNPWLEALKWAFWIFALGSLFLLLGYSEVIPKVIFG